MVLKEVYKDLFYIGTAVESIHDQFTNNEIGNPDKEALIVREFSSMTCANEMKPVYNMGWSSPDAREDYLPYVINPNAKKMLDWVRANGLKMRAHVMVWHSQCAQEAFCKEYKPVFLPVDEEKLKENPRLRFFQRLDPVCFVDRDTMLRRLESYIDTMLDYIYREGYAEQIYAWDVVNEAIELADKTETGLRNSYWYQVIGDDFIYWAFRFAKAAVKKHSVQYAGVYGIDPTDEAALARIRPTLVYNDYNEWQPDKKAAIIAALKREGHGHGSIIGEGLIDGIGMQGHISDNNDIDEYIDALNEYASLVREVQITELDVKCTCTNINREYYQAVFYKEFFERLLAAKKAGANLTSVTIWGLTDDNSWIRGADPLLFRKDLTAKKSHEALVYAVTGGDLGEPEYVVRNLDKHVFDFETPEGEEQKDPETYGFKMRGFGKCLLSEERAHSGKFSLTSTPRFADWMGITCDVSDFIGQTIQIDAWVYSEAKEITLGADIEGVFPQIATVEGGAEWKKISASYKVPTGQHSLRLFFGTKEANPGPCSPLFLDDVEISLIGQEESFEEETNIAAIRGAGHLPFIFVTDKESVDGKSKSLGVTRQEKDATISLDVSAYIGKTIDVTMFVKTADSLIRIGVDGSEPVLCAEVPSKAGEWTEVHTTATLPDGVLSAKLYVETDGRADFFVDDVFVKLA
jgi:Beta-1,4-xylanase|uniref:Putative carbohydrate-active enzyme n=1 Tax=uncultured organism TaxID=155900 RepID=E9NSI6_9ZZZZ|nr:putative carbohydrate-active enzyme [uncultured organism]